MLKKKKVWIVKEFIHGIKLEKTLNKLNSEGYRIVRIWKSTLEYYYDIIAVLRNKN